MVLVCEIALGILVNELRERHAEAVFAEHTLPCGHLTATACFEQHDAVGIEITPGHIGAMFDERAIRHAFHHDHMLGGERFEPVAHPHMQKQLVVFAQEIATGLDHAAVRAHDDDLVGLEFAYDVGRVRGEDLLARPSLSNRARFRWLVGCRCVSGSSTPTICTCSSSRSYKATV